jgi:hypothetical protein
MRTFVKKGLLAAGKWLPAAVLPLPANECFRQSREFTQEEPIVHALLVGASVGEPSTEGALAGLYLNPKNTETVCIGPPSKRFSELAKKHLLSPFVRCYPMEPSDCETGLEQVKVDNEIEQFQLVVLCGSEGGRALCAEPSMLRIIASSTYVLFSHADKDWCRKIISNLVQQSGFTEDNQYFDSSSLCTALVRRRILNPVHPIRRDAAPEASH